MRGRTVDFQAPVMLGAAILFVLIVAVIAFWPDWWMRSRWGYVPSTVAGILLIVTVALLFTNRF